jgi:hypothetical protein
MVGMLAALLADAVPRSRPSGVRVIAFVTFLIAAYLALDAILIMLGTLSLASGRYVLGDYATMGPLLFLVVAAALALLAVGLMKGWRQWRRFAVVAAALFFATAVLPVSAAFAYWQISGIIIHGGKIILAVLAIRYLLQPEVVEFFSAKSDQKST